MKLGVLVVVIYPTLTGSNTFASMWKPGSGREKMFEVQESESDS